MTEKKHAKDSAQQQGGKIAAVLIRGRVGLHRDVKHTLDMLRLRSKHACVVLNDDPSTKGMLQKVKDAITWGSITDETHQELVAKRGRVDAEGKPKMFFLLHPPRGGFERKGIKTPFASGGALGDRKAKMDDLVKRML